MYYNTVTPLLKEILEKLMQESLFDPFRLVGGTSLSLQLGHRKSVDIDLFTDAEYESINFEAIAEFLNENFEIVNAPEGITAMGKSYFIGNNNDELVKLDLFYTDPFIQPEIEEDGIRMVTIEEIIAMKLEVLLDGGRKKDFWDLHELISDYSLEEMLALHEQRYPYSHNAERITQNFTQFDNADAEFDPICLRGKYWEVIKLDLVEFVIG